MQCAKILVVDPDQADYEPLKPALARHGYELHTATTTAQALQLASVHGYKAALISLALLCDALLLAGLQTELPALPVIVIVAPDTRGIPAPIVEAIDNAIGKPLTVELVRLMLDRTLELALLRARLRQQRQSWWDVLAWQWLADEQAAPPQPLPAPLDDVLIAKLRAIVPSMEALGRGSLHRAVLSHVEKLLLTVVLTECRGNQVKSADILGINRNTLRKKVRELEITPLRRSV